MQATYLTTQLRESAPYVSEAGWHQTAHLLIAAAEEIERHRADSATAGGRNGSAVEETFDVPEMGAKGVTDCDSADAIEALLH